MLDRAERVRQNREPLREINERIARMDWADAGRDSFDFLCECGAGDCVATVPLTLDAYAALAQRGPVVHEGHYRAGKRGFSGESQESTPCPREMSAARRTSDSSNG